MFLKNAVDLYVYSSTATASVSGIDLWGCTGSDPHGIEILCMVGGGGGGSEVNRFQTLKRQKNKFQTTKKKLGIFGGASILA